MFRKLSAIALLTLLACASARGDSPKTVDSNTLHHQVLCGYQGWFRCPGDPANEGWVHWSRRGDRITPDTLTFEMWPDMREYGDDERYPARGFTHPDGSQAYLFSSANAKTVDRHFKWMQQYGLDGVLLQRFLVNIGNPSLDRVLDNVRAAAKSTGRVYVISYDMTAYPPDRTYETLVSDWKRLVDEKKVTSDDRYIHHNGKPVVLIWGFFADRFGPELANRIIDFFKSDSKYAVTLIGGVQWNWRTAVKDPAWSKVFRRFDVISPWNVGNVMREKGQRYASTAYWKDDMAEAAKHGEQWMPVIYPGFGWTNLKGKGAPGPTIPRLGGEFFWRQFVTAADLKVDMAYVAMFDEVDEGTAIFKVSNTPPTQAHFDTFDGLPADVYLRLAGEGTKLLRGERPRSTTLPIGPADSNDDHR
jgi:hypothetical protein